MRVFRAAIRKMIEEAQLPDYLMSEEPGDIIRFARIGVIEEEAFEPGLPGFDPDVLDAARGLAPGADVYALEAEWRAWWVQTGRPRLSAPERAFLAWVRTRKD